MQDDIDEGFEMAKMEMDSSIEFLEKELSRISTGKANPSLVTGLLVDYYGSPTPMSQVANIATADTRTITIQPWEKATIAPIERAIFEANLGVTPQNDGELVRISIPPLTEQRRKDLVKTAKDKGEDAKISIRSARRDLMDAIKKAVKDGYPEDAGKRAEDKAQEQTKSYEGKVDKMIANKEKDILTI